MRPAPDTGGGVGQELRDPVVDHLGRPLAMFRCACGTGTLRKAELRGSSNVASPSRSPISYRVIQSTRTG
jgi:hypothetical protein